MDLHGGCVFHQATFEKTMIPQGHDMLGERLARLARLTGSTSIVKSNDYLSNHLIF
jgi:hypothetical protein